ncbi:MFS transporter [Fastidiosibacter lacustris]|uniref:MFS transporter n=1 Tax=Fastidiosibacter lacustris TaxID=2056695 RepID=UPI000E34D478|nr:MFS transporter [Fastidiosibacter lacustris]
MKAQNYVYFFAIFLVGVYVCAYDMYISALPLLQQDFAVSVSQSQLTLTLFVIAGAVFAIPAGVISDKFGRKVALILYACVVALGSVICLLANSIYIFYLGRILQGIGASGLYIIAIAIPKDLLTGNEYVRAWQSLTLLFYVAPSIAGFIGGYIVYFGGWQSVFNSVILISILTLFVVLIYFKNPPSHESDQKISSRKKMVNILKNIKFLSYCYITSAAWSGMSIFYICTPYIVISTLGYSTIIYGWLSFLLILFGAIGRWINIRWLHGIMSYEKSALLFSFVAVFSGLLFIFAYLAPVNLAIYIIGISAILFGFSSALVSVNSSTIAFLLIEKSHNAVASSIYGLSLDLFIALSLIFANLMYPNLILLGGMITCFYILAIILIFKFKTPKNYNSLAI